MYICTAVYSLPNSQCNLKKNQTAMSCYRFHLTLDSDDRCYLQFCESIHNEEEETVKTTSRRMSGLNSTAMWHSMAVTLQQISKPTNSILTRCILIILTDMIYRAYVLTRVSFKLTLYKKKIKKKSLFIIPCLRCVLIFNQWFKKDQTWCILTSTKWC